MAPITGQNELLNKYREQNLMQNSTQMTTTTIPANKSVPRKTNYISRDQELYERLQKEADESSELAMLGAKPTSSGG